MIWVWIFKDVGGVGGIVIWATNGGPDSEWQPVLMQNPWCDE